MTRKQIRDAMDKHDAYVSKIGQQEAKRHLRAKEQAIPPTRGNIRAGLAFVALTIAVLVIGLAI